MKNGNGNGQGKGQFGHLGNRVISQREWSLSKVAGASRAAINAQGFNWTHTPVEKALVERIVFRARDRALSAPGFIAEDVLRSCLQMLHMDILNVHINGGGLDLQAFAFTGDEGAFVHDIQGIIANVDRVQGGLRNNFVPRFRRARQL